MRTSRISPKMWSLSYIVEGMFHRKVTNFILCYSKVHKKESIEFTQNMKALSNTTIFWNRMNYLGRWVPRYWVCLSRRLTGLCEGCFRSGWCSRWRSWVRKLLMFSQPYVLWNMFVIRFFLSHKENKIKQSSYISKIQLKFSICIFKHGLSRSITIISMLSFK